jgi:hypothetical protein
MPQEEAPEAKTHDTYTDSYAIGRLRTMTTSKDTNETHRVEIWFHIEKDKDGYPTSKEWEGLICACLNSTELFRVESVPLFVKGVAVGDIVSATETSENYYQYGRTVSKGGHSTYRLYIEDEAVGQVVQRELVRKGCAVEITAQGSLIAVDVPPDREAQVREHLFTGVREGRWELQEASVAGQ